MIKLRMFIIAMYKTSKLWYDELLIVEFELESSIRIIQYERTIMLSPIHCD